MYVIDLTRTLNFGEAQVLTREGENPKTLTMMAQMSPYHSFTRDPEGHWIVLPEPRSVGLGEGGQRRRHE